MCRPQNNFVVVIQKVVSIDTQKGFCQDSQVIILIAKFMTCGWL